MNILKRRTGRTTKTKGRASHRILVAEDDTMLRQALASALRRAGWTVMEARDGVEAQELVTANPPCLIFLDLLMPKQDGFQFLEWLRKRKSEEQTPVVIVTQLHEVEHRRRTARLGVSGYFVKAEHTLKEMIETTRALLADCEGCEQEAPAAPRRKR